MKTVGQKAMEINSSGFQLFPGTGGIDVKHPDAILLAYIVELQLAQLIESHAGMQSQERQPVVMGMQKFVLPVLARREDFPQILFGKCCTGQYGRTSFGITRRT